MFHGRNFPDASGRIIWVRSLLAHLRKFIDAFEAEVLVNKGLRGEFKRWTITEAVGQEARVQEAGEAVQRGVQQNPI